MILLRFFSSTPSLEGLITLLTFFLIAAIILNRLSKHKETDNLDEHPFPIIFATYFVSLFSHIVSNGNVPIAALICATLIFGLSIVINLRMQSCIILSILIPLTFTFSNWLGTITQNLLTTSP